MLAVKVPTRILWSIRFKDIDSRKIIVSDPVVIMVVCGAKFNTHDPSNIDQFFLARAQSGTYKKFIDHFLKETTVQMDIDPFVKVRATIEVPLKILSDRKYAKRLIINNLSIRTRRNNIELDHLNIKIEPRHFDIKFMTAYKDTADNYSEGKFKLIHYYILLLILP